MTMRYLLHTRALPLLGALLLALPLSSQQLSAQRLGRIAGSATDTTHEVLPGAAVTLAPGQRTTSTDAQGHFQFVDLAPGDYTVTVSFVGLKAATEAVTVKAEATASAALVLAVASSSQSVVVTAPRSYGEAEAINLQRTADNIVDALPESVITSLPNANVADAVGRLPGVTLERDEGEGKYLQIRGTEPRLSNVTVDGVELEAPESGVRQVKMDVIPADLVGSVQLNKTLEPDQSGDAIGGSVNLETKTAGSAPTLTLYSNGGLAPIDNHRYSGEVGGTAGRRFGSRQQLGAILSASYDRNDRCIDDVEPVPDALATTSAPLMDNADFRQYLYNRSRYGFGGSLDDTLSQNTSLYLRGLLASFTDSGVRTVYNVDATGGGPSAGSEHRIGNYLISSLILGGSHTLPADNLWINWQVSGARSRMLYPQFDDNVSFAYTGPPSQCSFNSAATTNPYLPQFSPVCFQETDNSANFQFAKLKMGNHGQSSKLDLGGKVDVSKSYVAGGSVGTLKFGASLDNTHQFDDSWQTDFRPAVDPATGNPFAIPMSQFLDPGSANAHYYNGNYHASPFLSYSAIQNYVLGHAGQFTLSSTQGQDSNNYALTERIPAAYVMDTNQMGNFRLAGGLRMEQTHVNTLSPDANNALTTPGTYSYLDFMPSASVQYRLDSSSDVRVVFGRGISRPVPADLTAATSQDLSVTPHRASLGNPALKPEHGNDFDLLYERYLTPLGEVRGGFFYKSLSDPIVSIQTEPTSGPFAGFRVTQLANGGSAHIAGFEFAFLQQFTYLPGGLRGLGLSGNYSYATSQATDVNPGNRTDTPRLLRQAPNTWNLSPTYDRGRFSGRVGLAYNGSNIFQYNFVDGAAGGIAGPSGDVYEYAHFQIDAQASVGLTPGLKLTLSGLNLNNSVFGFYQGSPQFTIQREYYQPTYSIGLRWTLGGE